MNNIMSIGMHCFGCTACEHICPVSCIKMVPNEQGFLFPSVNEDVCIGCSKCLKVCPYLQDQNIGAALFPETYVYAAKHIDDEIRMQSSSGGVFTAISDYILHNQGIVYGAAYDENMIVRHMRVDSIVGRDSFRGSKYVQSNLGNAYISIKKDLQNDRLVLFSGTPCQVAGLRKYLGKSFANLLTVDIVCHGVPSPKVFADYIQELERKHKENILDCRFRDKSNGWKNLTLNIRGYKKSKYMQSATSSYYTLFLNNTILRPCCYECGFTNFNRPGDITIGDYWGIEKSHPEFEDEKGVSLILINSKQGQAMFDEISDSFTLLVSNHQECLQKNLLQPTLANPRKDIFWNDYKEYGYSYVAKKYGGASMYASIRRVIKRILIN